MTFLSQNMSKRKLPLSEDEDENKRYFLNPESVSVHLFCSICQEVFVCPQRAPCGHSFCKRCILTWLQKSSTCPEDRRMLQPKDLHHDFIVENIIGDQMCATHLLTCCFNPANLPDFLRADVEKELKKPTVELDASVNDSDSEVIPTPAKPSLRMRLFQAGGASRDLLCSAFNSDRSSSSLAASAAAMTIPLAGSSLANSRT